MGLINQLSRLAAGVVPAFDAAKQKRAALAREIAALERAGIVNATPFLNKGKYLYLSYPMHRGVRRREYIGADQDRIAEVLAKIERFKQHRALSGELDALNVAFQDSFHALRSFYDALESSK